MPEAVVYNDGAAGPWHCDWVSCLVCTYRWIAVFPDSAVDVECPSCESMMTEAD